MPIFGDKQISSITIKINQLSTPHQNDEIDEGIELYLSDLLHLIKIQPSTGATEAARAIRKKIKYGELVEGQLRTLQILELLVLNSGVKIGPVIARDDKLLDVLKGVITGDGKTGSGGSYDQQVSKRVRELAIGWKSELDGLDGYKYLASLWKVIPRRKQTSGGSSANLRALAGEHRRTPSGNVFESELDSVPLRQRLEGSSTPPPPRPRTQSPYNNSRREEEIEKKQKQKQKQTLKQKQKKKRSRNGTKYADEQYKIPQINYKVEAPKIRNVIAECHTHTTALQNGLLTLTRGNSPMDDEKCSTEFDKCRSIRRKVLRYLQFVGAGGLEDKSSEVIAMDEEFLGSLIYANEQLVDIFKRFDSACGYTAENPAPQYEDEDDSDESYYTESSEEEEEEEEEPEDNIDSVHDRLSKVTMEEGSSSSAGPRIPPPRPSKPSKLAAEKSTLTKYETNDTVESDPFGDGNAAKHSAYD